MKSRTDEDRACRMHGINTHNGFARIVEYNRQIVMLKRRREHNIKRIL
jgi:hypothetical protein